MKKFLIALCMMAMLVSSVIPVSASSLVEFSYPNEVLINENFNDGVADGIESASNATVADGVGVVSDNERFMWKKSFEANCFEISATINMTKRTSWDRQVMVVDDGNAMRRESGFVVFSKGSDIILNTGASSVGGTVLKNYYYGDSDIKLKFLYFADAGKVYVWVNDSLFSETPINVSPIKSNSLLLQFGQPAGDFAFKVDDVVLKNSQKDFYAFSTKTDTYDTNRTLFAQLRNDGSPTEITNGALKRSDQRYRAEINPVKTAGVYTASFKFAMENVPTAEEIAATNDKAKWICSADSKQRGEKETFWLGVNSSEFVILTYLKDSNGIQQVILPTEVSASADTWYHFRYSINMDTKRVHFYLNKAYNDENTALAEEKEILRNYNLYANDTCTALNYLMDFPGYSYWSDCLENYYIDEFNFSEDKLASDLGIESGIINEGKELKSSIGALPISWSKGIDGSAIADGSLDADDSGEIIVSYGGISVSTEVEGVPQTTVYGATTRKYFVNVLEEDKNFIMVNDGNILLYGNPGLDETGIVILAVYDKEDKSLISTKVVNTASNLPTLAIKKSDVLEFGNGDYLIKGFMFNNINNIVPLSVNSETEIQISENEISEIKD